MLDHPTIPEQEQPAADGADWVLVLKPLPSDIPAEVRMKRLLKCLLRGYQMRCVSVSAHVPPNSTTSTSGGSTP